MNKTLGIAVGAIIVLAACGYGAFMYLTPNTPAPTAFNPRNATYTIESSHVTLANGKSGSVELFGNGATGDVNNDGTDDAVFFLTQSSQGTGTFYYVVAALRSTSGTTGTNAVLLGDRIAPQNITIAAGIITVTYADRATGEPMTTPPSVGKSKILTVQNGVLVESTSTDYTFTYLTSPDETTAYCDGANMDTDGYRASLTIKHTGTIAKANPTISEILRATIDAATTGMCHTVMSQTTFTEKDGVVTISPIDAWAGISISMCSCKPQVEVNILQIPGMKKVIWSDGSETAKSDIVVTTPTSHATVTSPLLVTGSARGSWFFEASFPVSLVDSHGNMLGQGVAQAQGDWMTNDFVPFTATITFTADTKIIGDDATLVLKKDNPSGLPANDDELRVSVILGK
ncbi:MAG: Gmad2 immunoglobulin-like domain-containing protein [Patescibacteria group bacterium]